MLSHAFTMFLQLFFIFTPFFVLSMFLTLTHDMSRREKRILVWKMTYSVEIICLILIYGGWAIFSLFSITVDSFRIGAGAILFISAVDLVQGKGAPSKTVEGEDISVVPLSIPIVVGPATTGTLMVMGNSLGKASEYLSGFIAVTAAVLMLSLVLLLSPWFEKILGRRGLLISSRLSGLILSALSAQMIFTGIRNFLN